MINDLSHFASCQISVDLSALTRNASEMESLAGVPIAAVVKANAYGLGVARVAPALASAGVRQFFVATLAEGCELRELLGPDGGAIMVFEGPAAGVLPIYSEFKLTPVINDAAQIGYCEGWTGGVAVHVDTGMNRLGFDADELIQQIRHGRLSGLRIELLMSHLACADEAETESNTRQAMRFAELASALPDVRSSLANSAGVLLGAAFVNDMPRVGIALYGGQPAQSGSALETVVTCRARVMALRAVAAGESVGYGATFVAQRDSIIAVLGMGYADGLPRQASNRATLAFAGNRLPLVGRVSMDFCTVDVSDCAKAPGVGDWIEVFGPHAPVAELAAAADTIDYAIFTGLSQRPSWRYVWDSDRR